MITKVSETHKISTVVDAITATLLIYPSVSETHKISTVVDADRTGYNASDGFRDA